MADELFVAGTDGPALSAVRCWLCGFVDFPPQTYGCRRCGANGHDLVAERIPAVGTVRTSAVVHHHADPSVVVPYTVATVHLSSGPITRVVMRDNGPLSIGDPVRGEIVDAGDGSADLRFAKEGPR